MNYGGGARVRGTSLLCFLRKRSYSLRKELVRVRSDFDTDREKVDENMNEEEKDKDKNGNNSQEAHESPDSLLPIKPFVLISCDILSP